MGSHYLPFRVIELIGLQKYGVRYADLADIMQARSKLNHETRIFVTAKFLCQQGGEFADAIRVFAGRVVSQFRCNRKPLKHLNLRFEEFLLGDFPFEGSFLRLESSRYLRFAAEVPAQLLKMQRNVF
jgi:hypothetical protein